MDEDVARCLVGLYVYNIYSVENCKSVEFYYVLGWHIQQSYPKIYSELISDYILFYQNKN